MSESGNQNIIFANPLEAQHAMMRLADENKQLRVINAELLEALRDIENTSCENWEFDNGNVQPKWRMKARAAIAKAQGGT